MDTPFNETLMWPDGFSRVHSWGYYMAAELCLAYMVLDIIGEPKARVCETHTFD